MAMRTMPCTPISVKRRESFLQSAAGLQRFTLHRAPRLLQQYRDCRRGGRQIAELVRPPGHALLRFEIDQQERCLAHRLRARAEHVIHRHLDGDGADIAEG
jgi:hypothetical protein